MSRRQGETFAGNGQAVGGVTNEKYPYRVTCKPIKKEWVIRKRQDFLDRREMFQELCAEGYELLVELASDLVRRRRR